MLENFTPVPALAGGVLIGLGATVLLVGQGRIAGISGILGGLLAPRPGDVSWRAAFLGGMLAAGAAVAVLWPGAFDSAVVRSPVALALAGLLVGFGTRLGNGCTSGHGVCGLSRLSARSLAATVTFMAAGALTAFLVRTAFGGVI